MGIALLRTKSNFASHTRIYTSDLNTWIYTSDPHGTFGKPYLVVGHPRGITECGPQVSVLLLRTPGMQVQLWLVIMWNISESG